MEVDVYKEWLGIPEGPRPPDHYELLRLVRFEDSIDKVRAHYKKLNAHVRKYATGRYATRSQELLNELARAMLCLTDPERKREYDESLGRVFEEDESATVPMDRVLVRQGQIDREQMQEAQEYADSHGLSMRDAVVQMKLVDDRTATQALAQELKVPYVDLGDMAPEMRILKKLPQSVAKRNSVLPLFIDDDMLLVACADELPYELEDELRLRFNVPVRRVMVTPKDIRDGINRYYSEMEEFLADEAELGENLEDSKKGRSKEKPAEKPSKAASPSSQKAFSQLSREEQEERKSLGKLFMLWSVIGAVLFDQFVLKNLLVSLNTGVLGYLPSLTTLIVPPLVITYVLKVYWK